MQGLHAVFMWFCNHPCPISHQVVHPVSASAHGRKNPEPNLGRIDSNRSRRPWSQEARASTSIANVWRAILSSTLLASLETLASTACNQAKLCRHGKQRLLQLSRRGNMCAGRLFEATEETEFIRFSVHPLNSSELNSSDYFIRLISSELNSSDYFIRLVSPGLSSSENRLGY